MGVQGLWGYVSHHGIQYQLPAGGGKQGEAPGLSYITRPAHLLLDMNALLHQAYDEKHGDTKSTIAALDALVRRLLTRVQPCVTLVVVFDGVTPVAKLLTQKERRKGLLTTQPVTSQPVEGGVMATSKSGKRNGAKSYAMGDDPITTAVPLRREEIVTGSEFVFACGVYVERLVRQLVAASTKMREVTLHVSLCTEPGEGEVKLARFLRRIWQTRHAASLFDPNESVVFVGDDSDLVLVSLLALPFQQATLLSPSLTTLTKVSELMQHWRASLPRNSMPSSSSPLSSSALATPLMRSFRVDFVFLMLLAGCDYYEGIGANGSVALWRNYRELRVNGTFYHRPLLSGPGFTLDVELMQCVVAKSAKGVLSGRVNVTSSKSRQAMERAGTASEEATKGLSVLRGAMWQLQNYVRGCCINYTFAAQQDNGGRKPTIGNLRAALRMRGVQARIHDLPSLDLRNGAQDDQATPPPDLPLLSALEQGIAVLGMHGKYSAEVRRAMAAVTPDMGARLSRSASLQYIVSTARSIAADLVSDRLSDTERALLACAPRDAVVADENDEVAYMTLVTVHGKRNNSSA